MMTRSTATTTSLVGFVLPSSAETGSATVVQSSYPFSQFVLKIYERCNLACRYCYMYEMADQTWRERPVRMSAIVFEQLSKRIVEHVDTHGLETVELVLHGGEPLLRGREFIAWAVQHLRKALPSVDVVASVQTNGTRLDPMMLKVLNDNSVSIGVSIDGTAEANDRHRVQRDGSSTHASVVEGIERLRQPMFRHLFRNLYATIDLRNDPIETLEFLLKFEPPVVDFLLPHANWNERPPTHGEVSDTPYADWLIAAFDHWHDHPGQTSVRLFHNILVGLAGGQSEVESIGLSPVGSVYVDTDGSIEQVDALKSAFDGAPATGLNVADHSFDEVLELDVYKVRQRGAEGLGAKCRRCELVEVCGGGYYPHRYDPSNGFGNASVYCGDLFALICHVRSRVEADLNALKSR